MSKSVRNAALLFCVLVMTASCVSVDQSLLLKKPLVTTRYYTFTVLLIPEMLNDSPVLDIALALVQVHYPKAQTEYLNDLLYMGEGIESYKDRIIQVKRAESRNLMASAANGGFDMRYAEKIIINDPHREGVVIERYIENVAAGLYDLETKQYLVVDLDELRLIRVDDIFGNFQGNDMRDLVYSELRKFANMREGQRLSQGIFNKDEPELSFNFFITKGGIGLHWDPYQIAPLSAGPIEIVLPWRSIRPFMLHTGIELLAGKFGVDFSLN
jgi:hypothetical protein